MERKGLIALAGAAAGVGAGLIAQRRVVTRRRSRDPEAEEPFGRRRGERSRTIALPDGAKIFIEEVGPVADKGVVFVHGSVLRTDAWHYQMPGLGDHRLVFYDLRGHGLSQPKGEAEFSIGTMAEDLLAVIEDCGLKEVVIVGHSVGGMIALETCVRQPDLLGDRIKGLVLLNATHRPGVETVVGGASLAKVERLIRRPLDALARQADRIEQIRRIIRPSDAAFVAVSIASFGRDGSAKQIDFVYDMLTDTPIDVIFDLIRSYRSFDVTDELGAVTVPVAVVAGSRDRITVPGASVFMAENLPKAELHLLEGCGHMSMMERHAEVNELIVDFLADTLGAPGRAGR